MGYHGTRLLTNGEHDELWRQAFKSIPELSSISASLKRSNLIIILKELHDLGKISDDGYAEDLVRVAEMEGYTIK